MVDNHRYLSTACLHERCDYCQSDTGLNGAKKPAQCKFCSAKCICSCHTAEAAARRLIWELLALADSLERESHRMNVAGGESPRPPDYHEGHYVGVMTTLQSCAYRIRTILDKEN